MPETSGKKTVRAAAKPKKSKRSVKTVKAVPVKDLQAAKNGSGTKAAARKKVRFKIWNKSRGYKTGDMDIVFFLIVLVLLVLGIIMMFSASYAWAVNEGLEGDYYATKQLSMAAVGVVIMLVMSKIDYHHYKTIFFAYAAYFVPLILLVLVLFIGESDGGATRWIDFGVFQFQPSEVMKIGIIVSYSYFLEKNRDSVKQLFKGVLPFMVMLALVAALLMLQPHLSATIIIGVICIILLIVGGVKIWQIGLVGIVGAAGLAGVVLYKLIVEGYGYFAVRINGWLDPFADIQGKTWQTCQSLIAIGSGGLTGLGLGQSRQKYLYLPESKNDFVFSIVCEELGFVGAVTVILLFVLLIFRGVNIASKADDRFGMLLATGFTFHIGLQALLNIAVVSNFIPNTGISLPFFSYGGTALILQLFEMGVVLNISRERIRIKPASRRPEEKKTPPLDDLMQDA